MEYNIFFYVKSISFCINILLHIHDILCTCRYCIISIKKIFFHSFDAGFFFFKGVPGCTVTAQDLEFQQWKPLRQFLPGEVVAMKQGDSLKYGVVVKVNRDDFNTLSTLKVKVHFDEIRLKGIVALKVSPERKRQATATKKKEPDQKLVGKIGRPQN